MYWVFLLPASLLSLLVFANAQSQQTVNSTQDSWPHAYPGIPSGNCSLEWQEYFQVTESLPNVTWPLARNWAGNIPVQRAGHPNNTLFFWAVESSNGSFTSESDQPWGIWLNGGPGASSLLGFLFENGPIKVLGNHSVVENHYAWSTVADYVWIDQPVGTGFSTVDADGLVADEEQVAADFIGFLGNFVNVFPTLAKRPLYLMGESYAGTYIPYITKAYFEMANPPVKLGRIAIGDPAIGSFETSTELPVISVLETYPQIIGYNTTVFKYFQEQSELCGYNLTLQYPQPEHFPTLNAPLPHTSAAETRKKRAARLTKSATLLEIRKRLAAEFRKRDGAISEDERSRAREMWKRDLSLRANGTIDPWYQCDLYNEMIDYALNFTFPWSSGHKFDVYDIPDALSPEVPIHGSIFLNDAQTRAAIHAPTSKNWTGFINSTFSPTNMSMNSYNNGDPSVEPMAFLSDLATNATEQGVKIILYCGNDDSLVPHFGTQVVIQNTTFGGIQGFTRKPATPWSNDAGEFAGIVHQERNWTYVLAANAGHTLPYTNPISALTLAREFIFGNNQTGLVTSSDVIGGEDPSLEDEILRGQAGIYLGPATTASTYFFPSSTVKAWDDYTATETATPTPSASNYN